MAVRWDGSGVNQRITVALPAASPLAFSCWAKLNVDTNTFATLWALEDGLTSATHGLYFQTLVDGTTVYLADDGPAGNIPSIQNMVVGTWYFFFWIITGTNLATCWVAAEGAKTLTAVSASTFALMGGTPALMSFGNDSFSEPFNGCMEEIALWTVAKGAADALAVFQAGPMASPEGMYGYWPNLDSATCKEDRGPKGSNILVLNNGTLGTEAGPTSISYQQIPVEGVVGKAPAGGGAFTAPLAETVTVSEAAAAKAGYKAPLAETDAITEAIAAKSGLKAALDDLVSMNETADGVRHVFVTLAETVTVSEAAAAKAGYKALLSDAVTVLALLTSPGGSAQAALAETDVITAAIAAKAGLVAPLAETDDISAAVAVKQGLKAPLGEAVVVGESIATRVVWKATLAEAAAVGESLVAKAGLQALLAATVAVGEGIATKMTWKAQLGEIVTITGVLTNPEPASTGGGGYTSRYREAAGHYRSSYSRTVS